MPLEPIRPAPKAASQAVITPQEQPPDPTGVPIPDPIPPELPPVVLAGGPISDAANQAARDASQNILAAQNLADLIGPLNDAITDLQLTVSQHTEQIARLNVAMLAMPCPNNKMIPDNTVKEGEHEADIYECLEADICDCESGQILSKNQTAPD